MAKILLVEDDPLQAEITRNTLESKGFDVILASGGKAAIKIAKTEPVDVILLDFILPDLDGNEVCRFLKHVENTRAIPIIALTIKGSTEEKVTGLDSGADDYLSKPFSENELIARIYANLRTKALHEELKKMNQQLVEVLSRVEVLATIDPLTELYNRRHFDNIIEKEFSRVLRYGYPASCLMVDIDDFKSINDEYGHHTGDVCLKEVADIIRNNVRKIDTPARWGGEEFIVLLPNTNKENAFPPASRILSAIAGSRFSVFPGQITVSIGISSIPDPAIDTAVKFIHAADLAMYEAKAKGGNRIESA
ncbi:MAG: diguanylate cyclase [Nitrospirota bacterium]